MDDITALNGIVDEKSRVGPTVKSIVNKNKRNSKGNMEVLA